MDVYVGKAPSRPWHTRRVPFDGHLKNNRALEVGPYRLILSTPGRDYDDNHLTGVFRTRHRHHHHRHHHHHHRLLCHPGITTIITTISCGGQQTRSVSFDYHPFLPAFVPPPPPAATPPFASPTLSVPLIFCQKAISVMANKRNRTEVTDDRSSVTSDVHREEPRRPPASPRLRETISIAFTAGS